MYESLSSKSLKENFSQEVLLVLLNETKICSPLEKILIFFCIFLGVVISHSLARKIKSRSEYNPVFYTFFFIVLFITSDFMLFVSSNVPQTLFVVQRQTEILN